MVSIRSLHRCPIHFSMLEKNRNIFTPMTIGQTGHKRLQIQNKRCHCNYRMWLAIHSKKSSLYPSTHTRLFLPFYHTYYYSLSDLPACSMPIACLPAWLTDSQSILVYKQLPAWTHAFLCLFLTSVWCMFLMFWSAKTHVSFAEFRHDYWAQNV